ncbi:MAG: hypothetical protein V3U32_02085 [Anaerolineales bacterium]
MSDQAQRSESTHLWKLILLVIGIWIGSAILAFFANLLVTWVQSLDQVLDAAFFATLAGLSLAAASFLIAAAELVGGMVPKAKEESNAARDRADQKPDFGAAHEWYINRRHPSPAEIDAKRYSHEVTEYLHRRRELDRLKYASTSMHQGSRDFITSFLFLIAGLVEALSIDLLADAASIFTDSPESKSILSLTDFFTGSLSAIFVLLDLLISSAVLLFGISYLVDGARKLQTAVTSYLQ